MPAAIVLLGVLAALQGPPAICVDPGHPSEIGPGTRGKTITETAAAWGVAQELKAILLSKGYRVVLTKSKAQEFVANKERAAIANRMKADLLVRLHCDHAVGRSGFATFFADRPGRISGVSGPPPEVLARVRKMAGPFHRAAIAELKGALKDRGLRSDRQTAVGSKYGALIGSIHARCPSILVEMAVLSDPGDERFIASPAGRKQMARAIAKGIGAALEATKPASGEGSAAPAPPPGR